MKNTMLCVGILTLVGVVFSTGGSESPDTTDSIIEELTIYYDSLTQDELEVAAELVSVAIQQKQTQQKNFANQIMANKDQTDNNQLGAEDTSIMYKLGNKDGQLWRVENNKCNVDGLIKKIKGRRAGYRAVDTQEKTNYEKRYVNGVTNGSQGQFPW